MSTTIESSFKKLRENLEPTGVQKSIISTRQASVRSVISKEMEVIDSFLTGSYARSTMIAPLSDADIDIFIVLSSKYFKAGGQAALLDKVKNILLKTYTKTPKISRNGQAVTITFSDFIVDVVPAFNRKGGGYLIPDSKNKCWISTDPKVHVGYVSKQNCIHDGDLVPLIKMVKGWNRNIGYGFVSFYLELLVTEILKDVTITDFPSGMRYFLDKGREKIKYKVQDPVEFGGKINGLRNCTTVDSAVNKFEKAYNTALKAEQLAVRGNIEDAINEWRKLFGDSFPISGSNKWVTK